MIADGSVMDYVPQIGTLQTGDVAFCETEEGVHAVGASLVREGVLHYTACCPGRYYAAANAKSTAASARAINDRPYIFIL